MIIEITDKELTAIMAAGFTLTHSKEVRRGGIFVENICNSNSRRISFYEAVDVLYGFIDKVLKENNNDK